MRKLIKRLEESRKTVASSILKASWKALEAETREWVTDDLIKGLHKVFSKDVIKHVSTTFSPKELTGAATLLLTGEDRPRWEDVHSFMVKKFGLYDDDIHVMKKKDGELFTVFIDLNS